MKRQNQNVTVTEAILTLNESPLAELLAKPYVPPAETRRAKPLPKRLRKPKPVVQLENEPDTCWCGIAQDQCPNSRRNRDAQGWADENGYDIGLDSPWEIDYGEKSIGGW